MDNSSNLNGFQTPPRNIKTEDKLERMTWAPKREGNSNKVIIPFPMMYQKNIFSTPVKWIVDNPYTPGTPIKLNEGSLLGKSLDDVKKVLFPSNFSDSLRKRIEDNKLKAVKSKYPGAPMKRLTERKFTQRDLKPVKKRLFENKKNFSPYSRIL